MIFKTKRSDLRIRENYEVESFKRRGHAGTHILADFWSEKKIEEKKEIKRLLLGSAKEAKSSPLKISIYKFSPQGITGLVLLAESHIAVHTWPEIGYVAIDIFTCGKDTMPDKALDYFKKELSPQKVVVNKVERGKI